MYRNSSKKRKKALKNVSDEEKKAWQPNTIFLIFKKLLEKSLRAEQFCYKNTEMVSILTISVLKNSEGAVPFRHPRSYGIDSNVGLAAIWGVL